MQNQLIDRYLSDISCQHGIYLIGWFNCDKWSRKDRRKVDAQRLTASFNSINEAKKHFDAEAMKLTQPTKQVKAFVMNVSLP